MRIPLHMTPADKFYELFLWMLFKHCTFLFEYRYIAYYNIYNSKVRAYLNFKFTYSCPYKYVPLSLTLVVCYSTLWLAASLCLPSSCNSSPSLCCSLFLAAWLFKVSHFLCSYCAAMWHYQTSVCFISFPRKEVGLLHRRLLEQLIARKAEEFMYTVDHFVRFYCWLNACPIFTYS